MEYKSLPLAAARIKASPGTTQTLDVYASTFTEVPDSYGDVVARGAFARTLQEKGRTRIGLRDHITTQVVGSITDLREDAYGLRGTFTLVEGVQLATESYLLAKAGALTGVSIGYSVFPGGSRIENGIRVLTSLDLFECSLTAFPANTTATVVDGSDDAKALAASLGKLANAMKTWNAETRAQRKSDPAVEELDQMFKRLATARSMYGDADPFVHHLAKEIEEKIATAQLSASIEKLRRSLRSAA